MDRLDRIVASDAYSFDHWIAFSLFWFIFLFCHKYMRLFFKNNFYMCCFSMRREVFCTWKSCIFFSIISIVAGAKTERNIQMKLMEISERHKEMERTKVKNEWTNERNWERPEYWTGFYCPQPIANSSSINVIIGRHPNAHTYTM